MSRKHQRLQRREKVFGREASGRPASAALPGLSEKRWTSPLSVSAGGNARTRIFVPRYCVFLIPPELSVHVRYIHYIYPASI